MRSPRLEVRRIQPTEWKRLRSIRLEALADTPEAFITTLTEAEALPAASWRERARAGATGTAQATMIALDGDRTVGMAVGLLRGDTTKAVVSVVSVFVSRSVRRRGVGALLLRGVETWARDQGVSLTSLWVVDGNAEARSFYETVGYCSTLDRHKITVPPIRWETRFVKELP